MRYLKGLKQCDCIMKERQVHENTRKEMKVAFEQSQRIDVFTRECSKGYEARKSNCGAFGVCGCEL